MASPCVHTPYLAIWRNIHPVEITCLAVGHTPYIANNLLYHDPWLTITITMIPTLPPYPAARTGTPAPKPALATYSHLRLEPSSPLSRFQSSPRSNAPSPPRSIIPACPLALFPYSGFLICPSPVRPIFPSCPLPRFSCSHVPIAP